MCLILIALKHYPRWPLVIAANRDEFYDRPAAPLHFWPARPNLVAGRDLRSGGTWLGVTTRGSFAAVVNLRSAVPSDDKLRSRGLLVSDFLSGAVDPEKYARAAASGNARYNPFNLVVGNPDSVWFASSAERKPRELDAGMHAIGNAEARDVWPKVRKGRDALENLAPSDADGLIEQLLHVLADTSMPPDEELPDSGHDIGQERQLSPIFVRAGKYGTRASSVLLLGPDCDALFVERSFAADGRIVDTVQRRFLLDRKA